MIDVTLKMLHAVRQLCMMISIVKSKQCCCVKRDRAKCSGVVEIDFKVIDSCVVQAKFHKYRSYNLV